MPWNDMFAPLKRQLLAEDQLPAPTAPRSTPTPPPRQPAPAAAPTFDPFFAAQEYDRVRRSLLPAYNDLGPRWAWDNEERLANLQAYTAQNANASRAANEYVGNMMAGLGQQQATAANAATAAFNAAQARQSQEFGAQTQRGLEEFKAAEAVRRQQAEFGQQGAMAERDEAFKLRLAQMGDASAERRAMIEANSLGQPGFMGRLLEARDALSAPPPGGATPPAAPGMVGPPAPGSPPAATSPYSVLNRVGERLRSEMAVPGPDGKPLPMDARRLAETYRSATAGEQLSPEVKAMLAAALKRGEFGDAAGLKSGLAQLAADALIATESVPRGGDQRMPDEFTYAPDGKTLLQLKAGRGLDLFGRGWSMKPQQVQNPYTTIRLPDGTVVPYTMSGLPGSGGVGELAKPGAYEKRIQPYRERGEAATELLRMILGN